MRIKPLENEITELWNNYNTILLGYFIKKTTNMEDSKDLMAQTFAKYFISQSQSLAELNNPKAFLWKIADNLLIDYYKSRSTKIFQQRSKTIDIEHIDGEIVAAQKSNSLAIKEIMSCIKNSVSSTEFELLNQVYVEKISYNSISFNSMIKPATLRQKAFRGIQKAKEKCLSKMKEIFG